MIALITCLSGCSCKYHDYEEEVIKEPTCTEDGIKREYCTKCDYSVEETITARHDFQEEKVLREATCDVDGAAIYKCTVCGDTTEFTTVKQHSFSGRVCKECGYIKPLPELSVGMTKSQVKTSWGEPIETDSYTSSRGTMETWWYSEDGETIAVNFEVDGRVKSINTM